MYTLRVVRFASMPSLRRSRESAPNAIVGAARRIHLDRRDEIEKLRERSTADWQQLAWRYYDEIGEIKYAFNYFANVASRVRFFAGYQEEASDTPTPIGGQEQGVSRSLVTAARYELAKLGNGTGGQPNLIRSSVLNLLVAGELFLVGTHNRWHSRSTSELKFEDGDRVRLVTSRQETRGAGTYLPPDAFVARIWRTHPQYSDDADSSLKGVRADCHELLLLSRIIRASAQSRLNAGLLYVADELRFQRASDPLDAEPQPDVDPFEEELTLALTDPIGSTDSPSEIVPLIVRGPAEFAENGLKKIDLSRGFDDTVIERHDQTLQRILNGIDIPKDIITGLANVRYSNGRQISEDMYKAHVEPMILLLCEAYTTVFLQPQLLARGYSKEEVDRVQVWYDPSEVVVRPDRSEDADKGYERMLVSASAWRRAHGFSDSDAPTDEEIVRRIALSGSVAPSTTLDFLRAVAPDLVSTAEQLAREAFGDPDKMLGESSMTPDVEQQPGGGPGAARNGPPPQIAPNPSAPIPIAPAPPEGTLPPREVAAAQILETLHAITAASSQQSAVVKDRTKRLERSLEVERRLRESLFVHLNGVVQRALERAGARTVSKIRGDADLKSLVSAVPLEEAFATVPEDRRRAFALDEDRLIRDTLEKAKSGFTDLVKKAQLQGWRALGSAVADKMSESQDEDVERSWAWLLGALVTLAKRRLREPNRQGAYVSMETVRDAASLAGGATSVEVPSGPRATVPATPPTEPGPKNTGRAILGPKALEATEWEFGESYRWVYGISENNFEPHLKLDDKVFTSWSEDTLAAQGEDAWPYVTHYYPGDHNGCRCDWLPEVLDPKLVNLPERGQTWPDADSDVPVAASVSVPGKNRTNLIQSTYNGHKAVMVQEQEGKISE